MTFGSAGLGRVSSIALANRWRLWKMSPLTSTDRLRGCESEKVIVFFLTIGVMPYENGRTLADLICPLLYVMETSMVPEKSKEAMDESTVLNALWEAFGLLGDISELAGGAA